MNALDRAFAHYIKAEEAKRNGDAATYMEEKRKEDVLTRVASIF